eukprot:Nitzschia sp. Nitz4//scaffold7_size249615//127770//129065//NITZ4_001179-RA/size249615-processed-gene-0.144-mRNA-1//1//CDS//3329558448//2237//frame0
MVANSGSSVVSGRSSTTFEAQLITQATSTATVAARSILLSGGTPEMAMKTAKAAAASVLNPSDSETISGRSSSLFRRRKVKRQAEIVASMAVTAASANMSCDWSDSHHGNHSHPYARNITTRSMNTQDEPSVLSGSTRPPRPNTPTQPFNTRTSNPHIGAPPLAPTSSPRAPYRGSQMSPSNGVGLIPQLPKSQDELKILEKGSESVPLGIETTPHTVELPSFTFPSQDDDNGTHSQDDGSLSCPTGNGTLVQKRRWKPVPVNPFLAGISNAFNLLTCSPSACGDITMSNTAEDMFEDETRADDGIVAERDDRGMGSMDSRDQSDIRDQEIGNSHSGDSSVSSTSVLRELHSTSSSEAEIQVRSAIRETMERIVSKSKKGLKNDRSSTNKWQSYESKKYEPQDSEFVSTQSVSKKAFFLKGRSTKRRQGYI